MQVNLFEACLEAGIKPRILLVSSGQIYEKNSELPIKEVANIACYSPYSAAKACQETIANYYLNRGVEIVTVRPFNHIGPRQALGFIVPDFAHQIAMLEVSKNPKIIRVGNLDAKRDFTDVRDVVDAYIKLARKGKSGEVYNVCWGKSTSGQEILDTLINKSGFEIEVSVDPAKMRPTDIADMYGDNSKLTKVTGWKPSIELDQTLEDTLEYWRKEVRKTK
jgi:GDP-4-dehydro-6-deoxy-D-mannose reductase